MTAQTGLTLLSDHLDKLINHFIAYNQENINEAPVKAKMIHQQISCIQTVFQLADQFLSPHEKTLDESCIPKNHQPILKKYYEQIQNNQFQSIPNAYKLEVSKKDYKTNTLIESSYRIYLSVLVNQKIQEEIDTKQEMCTHQKSLFYGFTIQRIDSSQYF